MVLYSLERNRSDAKLVLRISKLTDYAILLMAEMAAQDQQVLSAQILSERSGLELPTVSKVLKLLTRDGLVRSYRGANGGYRIVRPAAEISVAEIIGAIEGPIAMTECSVDTGLCQQEHNCNLRGNWQRISTAVAEAMQRVSLAEMARPRRPSGPGLQIATFNS